jgi:predicted DCC family thiol-disulfide oxidoreductase YuxK
VNTELTKLTDTLWLQGWVLYDGACPICCRLARLAENPCTRRGFDLAPLQAPWVRECLGESGPDLLTALRVITPAGDSYAGADAILFLARRIWWTSPVAFLAKLPGVTPLLRRAYDFCAERRCRGVCNAGHGVSSPANPNSMGGP